MQHPIYYAHLINILENCVTFFEGFPIEGNMARWYECPYKIRETSLLLTEACLDRYDLFPPSKGIVEWVERQEAQLAQKIIENALKGLK
jgi:hypothetical protein